MPRPFTRAQTLENRAFLKELRRTGNIRLAAREAGIKYGTIQHRRAQHASFAQQCAAALVFAQAHFHDGGVRGPGSRPGSSAPLRTAGGEPVVVRTNGGRLQMRAAQPGKLTQACEQRFLAALSATANVRLSAAAAGASVAAFYRRRRNNPAFAREMRLALETGYERIEQALIESWSPSSHADDAWRHNDPPPIPPMSADQALMLLQLHQHQARLIAEPGTIKRRRGESGDAWSFRLSAMYQARLQRQREDFEVAEAARLARGEGPYWGEAEAPVVPDLAQVQAARRGEVRGGNRSGSLR